MYVLCRHIWNRCRRAAEQVEGFPFHIMPVHPLSVYIMAVRTRPREMFHVHRAVSGILRWRLPAYGENTTLDKALQLLLTSCMEKVIRPTLYIALWQTGLAVCQRGEASTSNVTCRDSPKMRHMWLCGML